MGTVLAVMFAALLTSSLCMLRSRWALRDIPVPTGVVLLAINLAVLASALTGVWVGPWAGLAAGVFAGVATVTSYTDAQVHLVPSGAIWVGVLGGFSALAGGRMTGMVSQDAVWGAGALLVVAALLAGLAVLTGGFGGGDVRFFVLVAATLWWVSLPTVLAGVLLAHFVGLLHAYRTKTGAPLVPYLTAGLVLAVVVTGFFFK